MKASNADRMKQLDELRVRIDENYSAELNQKKLFEDEVQCNLTSILTSDDSRRAASQLAYDADQQIVAVRFNLFCLSFLSSKSLPKWHWFFLPFN